MTCFYLSIHRYQMEGNQKEVHYQGTDLGQQIFQAHIRFHQTHDWQFYDYFSSLSPEQQSFLVDTLNRYAEYMESMSKEHEV